MPLPCRKSEVKVFCKMDCDYYVKPTVLIKGGNKTRNGQTKMSEYLIRTEFERQLELYLLKK